MMPDLLYHYTTIGAMLSIVEADELWLTDVRYLNDKSEHSHALYVASQILSDPASFPKQFWIAAHVALSELWVPLKVCSLSAEPDLLSQWRGYCATGGGVALGFHRKTLRELLRERGGRMRRAVYDRNKQETLLRRHVRRAIANIGRIRQTEAIADLMQRIPALGSFAQDADAAEGCLAAAKFVLHLIEMAAYFKDSSFGEERESRLILSNITNSDIRFRTGRYCLIPYTTIPLRIAETRVLREIVVGPTLDLETARVSVEEFAASKLPYAITVRPSHVPFRAWVW